MPVTRIKICCIASVEEAWTAIELGASAVGLVSEMPSGPGVIPEPLIATIASAIPPAIGSFLLTSRTDPEAIVTQQRRCRVNAVQLCDRLPPDGLEELRRRMPGVAIVQVLHVRGERALVDAAALAGRVDAILLDSGDAGARPKRLGGTGTTHDWEISRKIRDSVGVPVFLAGGLEAGNVANAIRRVRPFGVDVCTGVRTDGRLDPAKLRAFVGAVNGAGTGVEVETGREGRHG